MKIASLKTGPPAYRDLAGLKGALSSKGDGNVVSGLIRSARHYDRESTEAFCGLQELSHFGLVPGMHERRRRQRLVQDRASGAACHVLSILWSAPDRSLR
jgi:hypothetical protein